MSRHAKVRGVQIVLVSSPGPGGVPHWSHEYAAEFADLAIAGGATVRWLVALHEGQAVPPSANGLQVFAHQDRRALPVHKVASSQLDVPMESSLTDCLRAEPTSVVVHIGLGGQGSPNVLWLADRLGSQTFACVRGNELVCHRGDLLDREQRICKEWLDAERCRWCCSKSLLARPRSNDLRNRVDLFVAGLQTCAAIMVPNESDVAFVKDLGVAAKQIEIGTTPADLVARVCASSRGA